MRAQHPAQVHDEVVFDPRLERVDALLEAAVERGIGADRSLAQPARREDERRALGVEAQRRAEDAAEGAGVRGLAVAEEDLAHALGDGRRIGAEFGCGGRSPLGGSHGHLGASQCGRGVAN
jgi:hypothetical protein